MSKEKGFLVITRKVNESLYLPDLDIEIVLVSTKGKQARIGIRASKDTYIIRTEKYNEGLDEDRKEQQLRRNLQ